MRLILPDLTRFLALWGICLVNVAVFAFSFEQGFWGSTSPFAPDIWARYLSMALVNSKFFTLFSFMFGASWYLFILNSRSLGDLSGNEPTSPVKRVWFRRLAALFFLGLLHGFFVSPGDILVVYAVAGFALWQVRSFDNRRLLLLGCCLIVAESFFVALPYSLPFDENAFLLKIGEEYEAIEFGDIGQVITIRAAQYLELFTPTAWHWFFGPMGWTFIGFAFARGGLIENLNHRLWHLARTRALPIGAVLVLVGMVWWNFRPYALGNFVFLVGSSIVSFGYLGVLAAASKRLDSLPRWIHDIGRSSLSVYLLQSILMLLVFMPYGLKFWGKLSVVECLSLAISITALSMLLVLGWLRFHPRGPFELLVAKVLAYGKSNTNSP